MVYIDRKLKHCLRCGHRWFTRKKGSPKVCGKCRSPYWNKKKTRITVMGRSKKKILTTEERLALLQKGL